MKTPKENLPTQPPIAVVGLSALFPKATSADEFWSNIRRGIDAITEVPATHWNPDDYFDTNQKTPDMTYARRGGFLSPVPFDPLEYGISPNNLEAIDTSQLLGMVAAKRALEHAGYGSKRTFDRSRVGCILGVTGTLEMVIPLGARLGHPRWRKALKDAGVPDDVAEDVVNRISQSYVPWQENSFPGLLGNVVAGRIANRLDLHGTNCVVDAACASSFSAIHLSALELWTGRSDMVVTGGIDTFNDIFMFMCFSKTPALSPTGDSKPFSDDADGTILGEGVGMLVLKRLDDAERDGDRIYAILKGIGTSSDGAGNAVYAPKAEGQIRCLQDAYRVSGVSPDTIELVEAHGTGTKVGDATEVSGLMSVFKSTGRQGTWCAVGSVKSQIGHTKAAAGAAGIIKAILALQHRVLPPTIKVRQPPSVMLAEDSPFYVNVEARPWLKPHGHPRRAAVSAFGFGGSNFHCVLEESPQQFDEPDWDGDVQVVALSSTSLSSLSDSIRSTFGTLDASEWHVVRSTATASRNSFRSDQPHRLLFVIERGKTDLAKLASGAFTMIDRYSEKLNWSTPDGAYYGRGNRSGKLGILFPGQGSQYVDMQRELACRFPVMSDILSEANEVYASMSSVNGVPTSSQRLSDFIFPQPAFSEDVKRRQESELRATQIAQPALGAVSLAVLAVIDQFGVQPEAVAGHSYGELTALCASRRFAPHVLYRLSMLRGRLMAAAQEVNGGMLAIGAPLTQIEAALKELSIDLVVANHNSPTQVVLSGRLPEIDRAATLFADRNFRGKKLAVAAAFHSPLVAPASMAFRPVLEEVEFTPAMMPVYANSTGTEYPAEPRAARELLATQLARPVHFVREIEQMYSDGVRTFLEVGPSGVLTGLVNSILQGKDYRAIAIDSSSGKRSGLYDLASALAQLSATGYPVQWSRWDPYEVISEEQGNPRRLQIPICGANYVKPRPPIPPRAPMSHDAASVGLVATPLLNASHEQHAVTSDRELTTAEIQPNESLNQSISLPIEVKSPMKTLNPDASETSRNIVLERKSDSGTMDTIRQTLEALQRMQEETSRLHQQFLEGQEAALKTFSRLADLQLGNRQADPSQVHSPAQDSATAPSAHPYQELRSQQSDLESSKSFENFNSPEVPLPHVVANSPATETALVSPVKPEHSTGSLWTNPNANQTSTGSATMPPAVSVVPTSAPSSVRLPEPSIISDTKPSLLATTVLAVVSEKTGYPTDMLNLEMSLDHDLGIDSIKRVEILSALQERVADLPAFQPDELGALHTLKDVVMLAEARTAGNRSTSKSESNKNSPHEAVVSTISDSNIAGSNSAPGLLGPTVLEVVSEKTGYPTEMLNLDMSLDHDLGIDSIKRVEILSALQERVPDLPAFQPDELGALHTLRDVVTLAESRSIAPAQSKVRNSDSLTISAKSVLPAVSIPVPPPQSQPSRQTLGPVVLEVVAEKTGYPVEMLNLEMSLDHDLGIDSIKRVEILSALQERVTDLPAFQPDELGSLHTLKDVVALADARSGVSASPASNVSAGTNAPDTGSTVSNSASYTVGERLLPKSTAQTDNENRDQRFQHHRPDVNIASSLPSNSTRVSRSIVIPVAMTPASTRHSIKPLPGSDFWITEDDLGLSLQIARELTDRGFRPRIVNLDEPQLPIVPDGLGGLIIVAPQRGMSELQLWRAVEWLQKVGQKLRQIGATSPSIVATISRLDGQFGFDGTKRLQDPVSGGLAGLTKCAAREWPEVTSRAFDIASEWTDPSVAAAVFVTELLHEGPIEVGLTPNGTFALEVVDQPLTGQRDSLPIQPGDVVVISGGARGVTAEAAFAIARAWNPRLAILGRSPAPVSEPEWLVHLSTEHEIKQALIARATPGTAPKAISSQFQQIQASREIGRQLNRLRSRGVPVVYHSVDVRDAVAVKSILTRIRNDYGVIRGIIHGAGVLADQRIEDKSQDQFDRVFQTKIHGLKALLDSVNPSELKLLGLFSSYTARFGRIGQIDYAITNEVLNKLARQFATSYPHCRVASFNWGPWDGGMVQGGLKQIFASEGVGLIPIEAGANTLVREFEQTSSRPVEILVLAANDPQSGPQQPTSHAISNPSGAETAQGQPRDAGVIRPLTTVAAEPRGRNEAQVVQAEFKTVYERELDIESHPFLESHIVGGKAVLPVAMILEWLAHGAIHGNPGLELRGFEELRVYQGVRLGQSDRLPLRILSGRPIRDGNRYAVPVRLMGTINGRDVLHAAGTAILATDYAIASSVAKVVNPDRQDSSSVNASYSQSLLGPSLQSPQRPYSIDVRTAYSTRLFHGAQFRGIQSIEGCSEEGIAVTARVAPSASAWMVQPVRANWLADPLAVDAALQAIILWSQEMRGRPCLPCAVAKYEQFCRTFPKNGVRIVVRVQPHSDQLIRSEVEFIDFSGRLVARMENCESVADASLSVAFQKSHIEI